MNGRPGIAFCEMTFYEPNDDVRDTGAEVAEFDDAPPAPGVGEDEEAFDRNEPGSQEPPRTDR